MDLPNELWLTLFNYLPISTMLSLCEVSKKWKILTEDWQYWKNNTNFNSKEEFIRYFNKDKINIKIFKEYINSEHTNIIKFIENECRKNWNSCIYYVVQFHHKDLFEFFIEKIINSGEKPDWNFGMYGAASGGYKDLVDFFIEKIINSGKTPKWNHGMYIAAGGGHKDLVEFFIEKIINSGKTPNWYVGMYNAAYYKHEDLVRFFEEKLDSD